MRPGRTAALARLGRTVLGSALRSARVSLQSPASSPPDGSRARHRDARPAHPDVEATGYPGDFTGSARIDYRPDPDGDADPGEVVWGRVPFEEDHTQGKDRPALVVARDGPWVLALMLSSRDRVRTARDPRAVRGSRDGTPGQRWMDVGSGAWDSAGRPSEVRLDRVLRLDPHRIRREGAVLSRRRFDEVATELRALHGWT